MYNCHYKYFQKFRLKNETLNQYYDTNGLFIYIWVKCDKNANFKNSKIKLEIKILI
jgi:hypothetical protein